MKTVINSFLSAIILMLFSCSSNSDDGADTSPTVPTFTIIQNVQNIQELDNVIFSVGNPNSANIHNITWFVNNTQVSNSYDLEKAFSSFGSFTIKAKIDYNNTETTTIQKTVAVAERPKKLVSIKKVEMLSYAYDGQFYVTNLGYYVKLKFDIRELDESGSETIKYIATENDDNWGDGGIMYYPKVWDIASANYKVKVYNTGNYYPNNHEYYHTDIIFYAAKSQGLVQQPYYQINSLKLDLNPYRSLQPTTVTIVNEGMEIRLTLQWN